ncbi:TolC family protein [Thiobacillus sp. 63-78]|uniref:TolC family protein n=1 Tax=Thiobacillus sp. 63-78 TaxID=1895859 RepID=UPI001ACDB20F|nr:TolC family protein [Thiobacillus sp. 63-78]MBN8764581.1 TolC family protein [Thiobacillus sp.]
MRTAFFLPCILLAACLAGPATAAEPATPVPLHLADVEQLLVAHNRALIASRRASASAEAGIAMAAGRPNPTLSLNTSGINAQHPDSHTYLDTILRIDQPIERGGKRALRLGVADALLEASRSDESDSLRQQRMLARQAYFDLKAAEDRARLGRESARLAHQVLSKAEWRLKAGDLAPTDVARIRADTLRADSDASQAEVDHQRARLALAQLLAMESDAARLATADPWPRLTALPALQPDLNARPDVIAALHRVAAADQAIDLARAQRVRDVTVGAQFERNNQDPGSNLIGVGVSVPLFTGYDFRGELRQAYVARESAQDELERVKAAAAADFNQSTFEAGRLSERARHLRDEALPAARKASAAVQFAFSQGAASTLDVIDARRSLYAVETDTVNALDDAAKARAAWAAAMNLQELP